MWSRQCSGTPSPPCSPTGSPSTEPCTEVLVGLGHAAVKAVAGGHGHRLHGRRRPSRLDLDVGLLICGRVTAAGRHRRWHRRVSWSTAAVPSESWQPIRPPRTPVEGYETALTTGDSATRRASWRRGRRHVPIVRVIRRRECAGEAQDGHGVVVGAPRTDDRTRGVAGKGRSGDRRCDPRVLGVGDPPRRHAERGPHRRTLRRAGRRACRRSGSSVDGTAAVKARSAVADLRRSRAAPRRSRRRRSLRRPSR